MIQTKTIQIGAMGLIIDTKTLYKVVFYAF
jgi:hypothetical protein